MKKHILTISLVLITFCGINAQGVSSDALLGEWKLQTVTIKGDMASAEEAFGTSEIFQEYKEKKKFIGTVADQSQKGKWTLSTDKKLIIISIKGTPDTTFTILSFGDKKMTVQIGDNGQEMQLNYKKQ